MSGQPAVWEMVREAVHTLEDNGNRISFRQIHEYILGRYDNVLINTIDCQIRRCSVNSRSRMGYHPNKKPRTANGKYDFLYLYEGVSQVELYNPEKHGHWEIAHINNRLVVRCIDESKVFEQNIRIVPSHPLVFTKNTGNFLRITERDIETAYGLYVRGNYDNAEKLLYSILTDPSYRYNVDERIVAMKIGLIDTLYSTNLNKGQSTTSLPEIANTIANPRMKFDERILSGDISVVVDILKGARNNFSFVSKYCKIHEYYLSDTDSFAIYDSIVSENLFRFLPHYNGITLHKTTPKNICFNKRDYTLWCELIDKVIEFNELQEIPKVRRKIDWFIWGKFNNKD